MNISMEDHLKNARTRARSNKRARNEIIYRLVENLMGLLLIRYLQIFLA